MFMLVLVMGMIILFLAGLVAFILSLLIEANREVEMWRDGIEPPEIDWERWDRERSKAWEEAANESGKSDRL